MKIYVENDYIDIKFENATNLTVWTGKPFVLREVDFIGSGKFLLMTDYGPECPYELVHDTLQNLLPFETCHAHRDLRPKTGFWYLSEQHIMLLQMIVPDLLK